MQGKESKQSSPTEEEAIGEIALEFPIIPFRAFHCRIRAAAATDILLRKGLCPHIGCTNFALGYLVAPLFSDVKAPVIT